MPAPPVAELVNVSKRYGAVTAADRISLEIRQGEFFSILGPSGCGKTTALRLLAGFEQPDDDGGEVRLLGERVNGTRPYERPLSMVFQNYALFPHLSVERNVAFGLEQRRTAAAEMATRVRDALALVRLDPATYARRMPSQLSGGQRQRVALARALVLRPAILLLDEPLGAIDLLLRKEMQLELKSLNEELGITFVYVTHDQDEALTMSDRIAVMANARVAQLGTPADVYENPRTAFVARFIGESNFFEGIVTGRSGAWWHVRGSHDRSFRVPGDLPLADGRPVRIAVRPEWLDLSAPGAAPAGENVAHGHVRAVVYGGQTLRVVITLTGGGEAVVALRNEGQLAKPLAWTRGDAVGVTWLPEDCQLLEDI